MKLLDAVQLAASDLVRSKTRAFLTVVGVLVGTASLILMVSIGLTSYRQYTDSMEEKAALRSIYVTKDAGTSANNTITDSDIQRISEIKHVEAASPVITFPISIEKGRLQSNLYITAFDSKVLELQTGEKINWKTENGIPTLLLGRQVMENLQDESDEPDLDLTGSDILITAGYIDSEDTENVTGKVYKGQIAGVSDDENISSYTYMRLSDAAKIIRENRDVMKASGIPVTGYSQGIVIIDQIENVSAAEEEIRALGLEPSSPLERVNEIMTEKSNKQQQLLGVSLITLFVSVINIANTMLITVTEKRKEIGVMKVLGTTAKDIRCIYFLEAGMLGFVGGLLGVIVSHIFALLVAFSANNLVFLGISFSAGAGMYLPVWLDIAAILLSVAISVAAGVYPAQRAARMSPVEAMI